MTGMEPLGFFGLDPRHVAVVMIDFQNDFCSPEVFAGQPATNTHNAAAAVRANRFAVHAQARGAHVVYTRQVLDVDKLTQRQRRAAASEAVCVVGSWGAELFVDPVPGSAVIVKHRYDCWRSVEFVNYLDRYGIDGLVICGVELVCCVLYAILGAAERGYPYLVPAQLVSGQDTGDATDNRAVRDWLRYNQSERLINDESDILDHWPVAETDDGRSSAESRQHS
jgi:nicotinamidase-related amidase